MPVAPLVAPPPVALPLAAEFGLARRAVAELLGTAGLVVAVVGSGIAASRLSPDDVGLQLLENALATGAALFVLITLFGPISGAQLNPVVTLADRFTGGLKTGDVAPYLVAQVAGGILGVMAANLMFDLSVVEVSTQVRSGAGLWLSEVLATAGLVFLITALVRSGRAGAVAAAVGGYIGAAYFFTSSTAFANPAVTVGRIFSDTFAGIAPASAGAFVLAQIVGGALAVVLVRTFYPGPSRAPAQPL